METESILLLVGASAAVVYAIYKRYLLIKPQIDEALADGELSLDEVMDLADDVVEFVEDAKEIVESMPSKSALMKMTKPELVEFAQGHGVDVAGTKSAIVERLVQLSK
jgi:hypothetical protein